MGPVPEHPIQERYGHTGESPVKGHEDGDETGPSFLHEKAEKTGTIEPKEGKVREDLIRAYEYLK